MSRFELRPSKPQAVFIAIGALAVLIFGTVQMVRSGEFHWFFVLWVAIGLLVAGGALVQGFSRRPGTAVATGESDEPPLRMRLAHNRPLAVIGAVVGVGVIAFASVRLAAGQPIGTVIFFAVFGLAIIAFNLWAAFGRRGSAFTVTRRD